MATRTPRGTAASRTTKSVAVKAATVPPADEPVKAAPAAAETTTAAETPAVETPVAAPPPVAETVPPADAPVAHAVEEVKAAPAEPAPVQKPAAPAAKPAAVKAAPVTPKTVAKPAAAPAAPAPAAATKPVPAAPVAREVEQAIAYTKEKVEKMSKQVFASFDDVTGFHKDNVEAFVASTQILGKGLEALSKELVAFSQSQYEQSMSTAKALMGVKSVKELVDLQTEYAKTAFDAFVAEATKVSESGFKVANQAAEPLTARVNATVEKLSKVKAA
jgi:phasin family protein